MTVADADDNVHSIFEPDEAVIRAHLERMFRRARQEYPGGLCEIAWADNRGQVNQGRLFPITPEGLAEAAAFAVLRNKEKRNVYFGVNPRKPGTAPFARSDAEDVEVAYFQFADCDSAEASRNLRKAPLPYTFAVTTGRVPTPRVHPYWELDEAVHNLDAWSNQQRSIAHFFGGDPVINRDRIMRLAGTVNYPSPKKVERGYHVEKVTIRTLYDYEEERDPTSSEALFTSYPWGHQSHEGYSYDPDTGEVFEEGERPKPNFGTSGIDAQECVRKIKAGIDLHNNTLALIDHLIGAGYRDWLVRDYLTILLTPVSDGGTIGLIDKMIRTWRQKTATPDPEEEEDFSAPPPPPPPPFELKPVGLLVPKARPARDWLVPYRMMRRHVTMTTAAPGVGKSTLTIEEAVSMASGIDFLGFGIKAVMRVAIINNEETRDELERRIEATCTYFGVPLEAIAETLFLYSGVDAEKIVLARADKDGNVFPTVHTNRLKELVFDLRLDSVILDPFVQMHYVSESSNEEISRTMVQMRSVGTNSEHSAAIHVVHHNRKPPAGNSHQAGDLSAARGASSMGGEAHFFFTLTDMGDEDGEKLNIAEDERVHFLRLDDAKRKMAPAQGAKWYERHGVLMPYGLMGEEIGVLIPKDMSELDNNKVSSFTATNILEMIDKAWVSGNPYSESHQAKDRWVVSAIMKEFQMTRHAAKNLIVDWLQNGMIETQTRDQHAKLRGLRVLNWPG